MSKLNGEFKPKFWQKVLVCISSQHYIAISSQSIKMILTNSFGAISSQNQIAI
jgi:hypothetical protein